MSWPYLMIVNAVTGQGDKITYSGPVVKKWVGGNGRRDWYEIDVMDTNSAKVITIEVQRGQYDSFQPGDKFVVEYLRGGFGIPYRWRFQR